MDYKIENKEAFKIVGVKGRIPIQFEGESQEIIKLAQSITSEQGEKMHSYMDMEQNNIVNASFSFDDGGMEEKGNLDHMVGSLTTRVEELEASDVREGAARAEAVVDLEGR